MGRLDGLGPAAKHALEPGGRLPGAGAAVGDRVAARKGASAQMGQAAEGAVRGTAFHPFRLAFLRLAKLDPTSTFSNLSFPRFEPSSSSRLRRLFPEAAGEWAAPRCAGGAARVQRSAFGNLRSACRNLRSAFRSCVLRSAAFCVQLRSESCVQLRSAFTCV
eukprot:gene2301-biopygen13365